MSVVVRKYKRGGWQVDVRVELPGGKQVRERKVFRTASKSAAQRWGQDRERHLLINGPPKHVKEVPTLKEFAPRFLDGHARANRQKPSGIAAKEMILRVHLIPALGHKRLDAISTEDVQCLKSIACGKGTEDGQQRAERVECRSEEGCGVGRGRADALLRWAAHYAEVPGGVLRLRRIRAVGRNRSAARPSNLLGCAAGRRGRAPVRRNDCAGVCGRRSEQAEVVCETVRLERPDHVTQRWAPSVCAAHPAAGSGVARTPAPAESSRAVSERWGAADAADDPKPDEARRSSERVSAGGRSHPASHVLFALGDAGCGDRSDSGTRRAQAN